VADTENDVERFPAYSAPSLIDRYNETRDAVFGHMTEKSSGTRFHSADDTKNTPLLGEASTLSDVLVGLADLRERVYERHRVQGSGDTPAVHTNSGGDTTNELTDPTKLDDLLVAYLDALADDAPTAATGEVDGAVTAAARGFRIVT
jgi:hypothetical protein